MIVECKIDDLTCLFSTIIRNHNIQKIGGGGWNRTIYQAVMSRLL